MWTVSGLGCGGQVVMVKQDGSSPVFWATSALASSLVMGADYHKAGVL